MHWQHQPDSLDVIGGGDVISGVPGWAGAGRGGRNGGQPARQRGSLQAPASLSAASRWDSHSA
jgi:hypothetical protein